MSVLRQILRQMVRKQNVTGVAAIHDTLHDIDSGACDIGAIVHVGYLVDRTTVNAHSKVDVRTALQCSTNLQCALDGVFRAIEEKQRHPISGWQSNKLTSGFGSAKSVRATHNLIQLVN